jgi:hypothetical protein
MRAERGDGSSALASAGRGRLSLRTRLPTALASLGVPLASPAVGAAERTMCSESRWAVPRHGGLLSLMRFWVMVISCYEDQNLRNCRRLTACRRGSEAAVSASLAPAN